MTYSNTTGLPSVTTIINATGAHWIPTEFFTEDGRERGSAVHEWCAAYAEKRYTIPLKQEWRGYCESFQRWADLYVDEVLLSEPEHMVSKYGYSGKPDLYFTMNGRAGPGLLDIKTGKNAKQHRLQIAAYRNLLKEQGLFTNWAFILPLRSDGKIPRASSDEPNDYSGDFNTFIGCLNTYNFYK